MTAYVALLRAINLGGTSKLPMADLADMCREAGFAQVKTYIASGNVVFASDADEQAVRAALEQRLEAYAGKRIAVLVRTAAEMAGVADRNPFVDRAGNRTMALFVDEALSPDCLDGVTGRRDEEIHLGEREIFVFYGEGIGTSKLRIPQSRTGTMRNMNTVAKLAALAAAIS